MNAMTPNHVAEQHRTTCESAGQTCRRVPDACFSEEEADRLFEAAVEWFLAVSRMA